MVKAVAKEQPPEMPDMPEARVRISDDLVLPIDTVVETFLIVGRRGRGKTSTAVVMAEELIRLGQPVVIVDLLGVWWGLRAGVAGDPEGGLPVVIFGGSHADVPINDRSGTLIAETVVETRQPAIIDLSSMPDPAEWQRFMASFAETLYRSNTAPSHLLIDEADALAPQTLQQAVGDPKAARRLQVALANIQLRGRHRGLGTTLVTQRPQQLSYTLRSQAATLICLGMTSPRDIAAVDEWVRGHADDTQASAMRSSLPGLGRGEAWVWSPGWLDLLTRTTVRPRRTFDSSATPRPGTVRKEARFTPVDPSLLVAKIAALADQAAGNDPATLQAEIGRLRHDLARTQLELATATTAPPAPVERLVPILTDAQEQALAGTADMVGAAVNRAERLTEQVAELLRSARAAAAEWGQLVKLAKGQPALAGDAPTPTTATPPAPVQRRNAEGDAAPANDSSQPDPPSGDGDRPLPPARQRILDALADLSSIGISQPARLQLALWAGVSGRSSGFANNLGAMRTAGIIDYPAGGTVTLTDTGRRLVSPGVGRRPPTNSELHRHIQQLISPARWRILDVLLDRYPKALSRDELATLAGANSISSGFANNLGAMRTAGLIAYPAGGMVVATPELFIGSS